ncbi:ABC transporter ATP-binding protein [Lactobacillus agrestimuris]|uniref:ABC transporter ATP-binding protein n=1 Tax=Lactobacillus agrestimuris TaxID=2941328 RepID=UPI002043AA8B|nr:ABC transporter ATP-binding protein [Lactobacillus agrestimuris]
MLIETYDLTKKYGKKTALNKVDLKINKGQLVAYLGTNGAGKSTTINILTGLLKPTSGGITYANNLKMGVVFQHSVLDDNLTVKDNLYFRAKMYKCFSEKWLKELIELIGIKNFLKQKYGTLSGGQKRRVDIARALIDKPDLLFLDEPTTGLDLQTRLVIWNLLQKLQREQGLTIFLTTHYLEEAENADQMYILENGNILANGSASEIKKRYAPSKLIVKVKNIEKLVTDTYVKKVTQNQIEIVSLSPIEVIDFLTQNTDQIIDFEYRKGSINDAFIKIAGKELQ